MYLFTVQILLYSKFNLRMGSWQYCDRRFPFPFLRVVYQKVCTCMCLLLAQCTLCSMLGSWDFPFFGQVWLLVWFWDVYLPRCRRGLRYTSRWLFSSPSKTPFFHSFKKFFILPPDTPPKDSFGQAETFIRHLSVGCGDIFCVHSFVPAR